MRAARARWTGPEEVLLDVNAMAQGHDFFNVGEWAISQDNRLLAWAEDAVGRRQYVVHVRNLDTGETYADTITGVAPELVWADDNKTLFYVENDPETLRTVRIKKHVLGTPVADDPLVYEEKDESFFMGISRTGDDKFICIDTGSHVSGETRCAPAADPVEFTVLAPRQRDVEYNVDHIGDHWVIRTNADGAENFKLMTAPDGASSRAEWKEWIAASRRRVHRGLRAVRRIHRDQRTLRRAGAHPPGQGRRHRGIRQVRRARVFDGAGDQLRTRHAVAALRLHLDDHADHHLRAQHADRRAQAAQAAAGAGLRPGALRDRAAVGDGARRRQDAGVGGLQERASRRTARAPCCSTPTAATAIRPTRPSA